MVVTINGLRQYMKRNFMEVFGNYEKVKQGKDYTISRCVKQVDWRYQPNARSINQ